MIPEIGMMIAVFFGATIIGRSGFHIMFATLVDVVAFLFITAVFIMLFNRWISEAVLY